jgi:hypothetical protein
LLRTTFIKNVAESGRPLLCQSGNFGSSLTGTEWPCVYLGAAGSARHRNRSLESLCAAEICQIFMPLLRTMWSKIMYTWLPMSFRLHNSIRELLDGFSWKVAWKFCRWCVFWTLIPYNR